MKQTSFIELNVNIWKSGNQRIDMDENNEKARDLTYVDPLDGVGVKTKATYGPHVDTCYQTHARTIALGIALESWVLPSFACIGNVKRGLGKQYHYRRVKMEVD